MKKQSTFEDAFADYLNSRKSQPEPPPRPFGALMRDMTIGSLMRGNDEDMEKHQDALAREAILNAQVEALAREKQFPAHLLKKLLHAKHNVDTSVINLQTKKRLDKEAENKKLKEEEEAARKKAKQQRAEEAARKYEEDVMKFDISSEADLVDKFERMEDVDSPEAKRQKVESSGEEPESSAAASVNEPEAPPLSKQEQKADSYQRRVKREEEVKLGKHISPEFQLRKGFGKRSDYERLYASFGQQMPEDFEPAGGFDPEKKKMK